MRLAVLALLLAACPEPSAPTLPKKPNNELIVGEFERHKPDGEQAIRFAADGSFVMAKNRSELDRPQPIATGDYKLAGDQLTFQNRRGACTESAGDKDGTYKVVISKIGIRFAKVTDRCQRRSSLDGQTWWRIR
jgi:hypothetical protein